MARNDEVRRLRRVISDLRTHSLFFDLPERCLRRAARLGTLNFVARGTKLVVEGTGSPGLSLVIDGDTQIAVDGRPFVVRHRQSSFGELSLLEPWQTNKATVTAETDCRILQFDRSSYDALTVAVPQLVERIEAVAHAHLHEAALVRDFRNKATTR
ncbi:MAG: cyclic nucleotide-binding domain-containing protein [Acidimicrobiales bacterium]